MKNTRQNSRILVLAISTLITSLNLNAEVRLPKLIGSQMVLQRDTPVKIWGWADKGEKVTVSLNGQEARTKTGKDGQWTVSLYTTPETGIDVSLIAKAYGGGGHKQAAGFNAKKLPFPLGSL